MCDDDDDEELPKKPSAQYERNEVVNSGFFFSIQ